MNYMLAWKGAYGISDYAGLVSPAYSVFEVDTQKVDPRFLHHRTRSEDARAYFKSRSKGIIDSRLRLYPDIFLASYVELPGLETQREIANFLDIETTRIDSMIEKKERMVALLAEKRSAIIDNAVNGYINIESDESYTCPPNQRRSVMKTTNLRWITRNLDYLRVPLNATERAEMQGVIPYWGANGIVDYINASILVDRVILIGEDGAPFFERDKDVAFISEGASWINNHIHILKVDEKTMDDRFLKYFLNQIDYSLYINGSTRDKLTKSQLGNISVSYPDLQTQRAIANFLDRESAQINKIQDATRTTIKHLIEYSSALITSAVTGQIDVRTYKKNGQIERKIDHFQESQNND